MSKKESAIVGTLICLGALLIIVDFAILATTEITPPAIMQIISFLFILFGIGLSAYFTEWRNTERKMDYFRNRMIVGFWPLNGGGQDE